MYIVTAIRDVFDFAGVEVAGIFETEEKAIEAKQQVKQWMKDNEHENSEVFATPIEANKLTWYDIDKKL